MDQVIEYSSSKKVPLCRLAIVSCLLGIAVGPILFGVVCLEYLLLQLCGALANPNYVLIEGIYVTTVFAGLAVVAGCGNIALARIKRTKARGRGLVIFGLWMTLAWALLPLLPFLLGAILHPN